MTTVTRYVRGAAAGLLAAGLALIPATGARASTGQPGSTGPGADQWWFANWQVQQEVWPLTEGAGVTVAVLDSGVQANLPDLRGVVLPGTDESGAGAPNGETDMDLSDDGHGTGMASLIAGQGYDGQTVGIAPRAKILTVSVLGEDGLDADGDAKIAAGIRFAVSHGAQVINISSGGPAPSPSSCSAVLQDAIAYALEHNVIVVAAAGNAITRTDISKPAVATPGPVSPASCAGVLAVGAVAANGSLWQYSIREPYVSVAAPGVDLTLLGLDGPILTDGTSDATALVSGTAALIRSRYPSMPWYQVEQRIIGTAIPAGNPVPNIGYGYGIVDLPRAVNASAYPVSAAAPDPVYARFQAWLASPAGQAFARQNGVPAGTTAASPAAPGLTAGTLVLWAIVAIAALAVLGFFIFIGMRRRLRRAAAPRRRFAALRQARRVSPGYGPAGPEWQPPQDPTDAGWPPEGYPPPGWGQPRMR